MSDPKTFLVMVGRDGTRVYIKIGPTPETEHCEKPKYCELNFCCAKTWIAALLEQFFDKGIRSVMEENRRRYYEAGWRDKAAKRKKQTWFPNWFGHVKNI